MKDRVNDIIQKAKRRAILQRLLALLSAVTILFTATALKFDATTMERERYCGLSEHIHTSACFDETGNLLCGLEEHTHTEACHHLPIEEQPSIDGDDLPIEEQLSIDIATEDELPPAELTNIDLSELTGEQPVEEPLELVLEDESVIADEETVPVYDLNGDSDVMLSTILSALYPAINLQDIEDVGEVEPESILVEKTTTTTTLLPFAISPMRIWSNWPSL